MAKVACGPREIPSVSTESQDLSGGQSGPGTSVSFPRPALGKHCWAVCGSRLARMKSRHPGGLPLKGCSGIAEMTTGRFDRALDAKRSGIPPRTPTPKHPSVWPIGVRSDSTDFDGAPATGELPSAIEATGDGEKRPRSGREMPFTGLTVPVVVLARRRICRPVICRAPRGRPR